MLLTPESEKLVTYHPRLYHMAERGSWPSIEANGLLSTTALLDFFDLKGKVRNAIENDHRPDMVKLNHTEHGQAFVRDQIPMPPARLVKALEGSGITPEEWYKFLNRKVFFWGTEARLNTLLGSRSYRNKEHDVLILNTKKFLEAYQDKVELCHMNSGNTFPIPHKRDKNIFKKLENYEEVLKNRPPLSAVAEVVVDYAVPDIKNYVETVVIRKDSANLGKLY